MAKVVLILFTIANVVLLNSAEKVLFGQPSSSSSSGAAVAASSASSATLAEPRATDSKESNPESGRKSRVFSFPQQNSRSRTYVVASPSGGSQQLYESSSSQLDNSVSSLSDENRLLSLLPSFGDNGMQVGLDFKLPFFNIPYAKLFSGLSAPIIGGSGFFGGSNVYSGSPLSGGLTSNILGSGSGLTGNLATMAAMAVTAALLYPKVTGIFTGGKGVFRDANGAEDFLQNLNSVLGQFDIDGEACLKVALCSLGNARRSSRSLGAGTTTPADIIDDVLKLPIVKGMLAKGGLVQARDFGGTGGDCDYYNRENKCPMTSQTWQKFLASIGQS